MNETKSKALLIVSLIAILAVSSLVVVLHTLYPPEHETLEVLNVDWTGEEIDNSIVLLRWFGAETDLGIYMCQRYSQYLPYMGQWGWVENTGWANRTVSYGCVFSITLRYAEWAQLYYDEVTLTLNSDGSFHNGTIFRP